MEVVRAIAIKIIQCILSNFGHQQIKCATV